MNIPQELHYTATHEWLRFLDDGQVQVGISDFAQDAMGDIVFVNLPEEEDQVNVGQAFADCESVKAVEDICSPVSGQVSAVNQEAMDSPEKLNSDPYGLWLIQVRDITATGELMDAAAYAEFCAREAH